MKHIVLTLFITAYFYDITLWLKLNILYLSFINDILFRDVFFDVFEKNIVTCLMSAFMNGYSIYMITNLRIMFTIYFIVGFLSAKYAGNLFLNIHYFTSLSILYYFKTHLNQYYLL